MMTKEAKKANMVAGAFLQWYEMAIDSIESMDIKMPWRKRLAVWMAVRRMKKSYKACKKDFTAVLEEMNKLDGKEGAEARATGVYVTIRRTFAQAKHEYEIINKMMRLIQFSQGGINGRNKN